MRKKFSKIFLFLGIFFVICAFALLLIHIYWGDKFTGASRTFFPPQSQFIQPGQQEFTVAIASDTGANNSVLEQIIIDAQKLAPQPNFMLYLGDFVTKKNNTGLYWILYEIKNKLHGIPMYSVPGNHDVAHHHEIDKQMYRSVLGPAYYWFGYGDVLFIGLDSSGKFIDDEQFKWLDDTLKNIRPMFKHCIIFSHRPPVDLIPGRVKNHTLDAPSTEKLESIVRKYKIDAMIFGHVHYYASGTFSGIPVYTTPSGGQEIRSDIKKYGYVIMTFNKNGIKSIEPKYIDFHGPKREYVEFWMAKNVFGFQLRHMVSILLSWAGILFLLSGTTYLIERHKS